MTKLAFLGTFFFSIPAFSMEMISSAAAKKITYWCTCSHHSGEVFFDEEVTSTKNCCHMHDIASDRNCAIRENGEAAKSCEGILRDTIQRK